MVLMKIMPHCLGGQHDKCPGSEACAPGEFGGVICECTCHAPSTTAPSRWEPGRVDEIEREFWRSIENSTDPDDFELYLRQFPNGTFAELARSWLAKNKP